MDYRKDGANGIRPRNASSGLSTAELFLGVKRSATDLIISNGVELDENDVVWAVDHEETTAREPKIVTGFSALSVSDGIDSNGNNNNNNNHRHSNTNKSNHVRSGRRLGIEPLTPGLSAALEDDRRSNLHMKPLANLRYIARKTSSASASRMIPSNGTNSSSEEHSGSRKYHQSAPVNVPLWSKPNQGPGLRKPKFTELNGAVDDDDDDEKDDERLPPHELLARDHARSHMTTFSVCEGLGRTLKGRDLSRVRNSVWRQTGFLD